MVARINAALPRAEKTKEVAAREQAQVNQWMAKLESDTYYEVLKRRMHVAIKTPHPVATK